MEKLECVDHIQKCLGSCLCYLKHTMKGPLADGKKIGGKGCLTDKVIKKLQKYSGIVIRQSTGNNIYQIKKAVGTVLFNCSKAADLETHYQMCP